jgi:glyoxylase-like metal-dependent hydrolase (beta-lactamase superfamily II)
VVVGGLRSGRFRQPHPSGGGKAVRGGAQPESILLMHGHFDHVGVARNRASGWGVPLYAHPLDMQYLIGQ